MSKDLVPYLKKKSQAWYMQDVDISLSFDSLELIAKKLGADVENGDILIVDNEHKTKRKIFRKTYKGPVILYLSQKKEKFIALNSKGKGKISPKTMLQLSNL